MKRWLTLLAVSLLLAAAPARAEQLLTVRSTLAFEEAMLALQQAITRQGYTLTRVQRVDVGMEAKGYVTDKYRIVFYGRAEEVRALSRSHPQLAAYLPLSVAIFAEGHNTIISALDPATLAELFPDAKLAPQFERWGQDTLAILEAVRLAR